MKSLVTLLAGACIAVITGTAAMAETVVLRYSNWLPPTFHIHQKVLYPYFEEIEKITEGRVRVELSAGPLGPPPRNYQMVADGVAGIVWSLHGYTPGTFPMSELVELPFHSTDAEENSAAYWKVFKEVFEPAGMHPGVHTLTLNTQPAGQLFTSSKPINAVSDLEGLKIRSTNSGVAEALTALGATPIGLPVTEMRDALAKGIVDGVSLTDEALYNFNIANLVKYELAVPGGLYNASMFLVVNQALWDQISPEDQEKITAISGEVLARKIGRAWQDEQNEAAKKVLADGLQVTTADGEMLEFINERLSGLDQEWKDKMAAIGIDGEAAIEAYRGTKQ
ncbi:MAG: TRAP transporter substrate-binding protein [Rhizobiaceae bacterium]|nr:TRAP transporter substrate-binding protein [Rhizobiaceae bacterium]